jgi:flagellar hook-basal body complex protein FliE
MNLSSITSSLPLVDVSSVTPTSSQSGASGFAGALQNAINEVESAQQTAQSAAEQFLVAGKGDVHNVALASQRADLTLELFQQVKNKFVQAYQEIMKTPM